MVNKKTAFFVSASSDIAMSISANLIKDGWKIYGTYNRGNKKLFDLYEKKNLIKLDLNNKNYEKELVKFIKKIDKITLFSCFSGSQLPCGPFLNLKKKDIINSFNINLIQPAFILKILKQKFYNNSKIIFFTGGGPNKATKNYLPYSLSKFSLIKFVELLAEENNNFYFACINPGWVNTKAHKKIITNKIFKKSSDHKRLISKIKNNSWVDVKKTIDFFDWFLKIKNRKFSGRYFVVDYDNFCYRKFVKKFDQNDNFLKMRRVEFD